MHLKSAGRSFFGRPGSQARRNSAMASLTSRQATLSPDTCVPRQCFKHILPPDLHIVRDIVSRTIAYEFGQHATFIIPHTVPCTTWPTPSCTNNTTISASIHLAPAGVAFVIDVDMHNELDKADVAIKQNAMRRTWCRPALGSAVVSAALACGSGAQR